MKEEETATAADATATRASARVVRGDASVPKDTPLVPRPTDVQRSEIPIDNLFTSARRRVHRHKVFHRTGATPIPSVEDFLGPSSVLTLPPRLENESNNYRTLVRYTRIG